MADRFISSVLVEKLGHKIQEIRERTLLNIISKLEHGFVYDNDLARSREILSKLFEWFTFESYSYENEVLKLIERIIKSESGITLIRHCGCKEMIGEIRRMRSNIDPTFYPFIDELIKIVSESEIREKVEVPPLQSEMPLSYRTEDGTLASGLLPVENTATPIEGLIQHSASLEQQAGNSRASSEESTIINWSLKWQFLIASDRHVLESVEQSLRNPTEPSALLHSCEFFIDVMLQDFPAEVFLQRPSIVLLLHEYLKTSLSTRLTNCILNCLLKFTKCLITRMYYYRDPCTYNCKQSISVQIFSGYTSSIPPNTERSKVERRYTDSKFHEDKEDILLLQKKQLFLPNYCFTTISSIFEYICNKPQDNVKKKQSVVGINLSLVLLDELICLLNLCVKSIAWVKRSIFGVVEVLCGFEKVLAEFGGVLDHFRIEVMSNECDQSSRVTHLRLLYTCSNLLEGSIPLTVADLVLPRRMKNALASCLLDAPLARLYPKIHETIFLYVKGFGGHFETESITKYKEVNDICESLTAALKFLRSSRSLPVATAIKLASEGVLSLDFHRNYKFIVHVVELCADKLPTLAQDDIFEIAEKLVLSLLAHNNVKVRREMYRLCTKSVVAAIGPKLNTSGTGAPDSQILFLLKSSILIEICLHGLSSENKDIQRYADDVVTHLLKCKILVSENVWNKIVQAIIPALPLLTCYAGKKSGIGRIIIGTIDPDSTKSLFIPSIEILRTNLCLLYVNDALAREEAVSRLCWLLASQTNSRYLLPRLNSLQDKALGTACLLQRIADLNKMRPLQHFYESSGLYQVLELLESENVEPVIRRSALTQIAVMLEDPLLHRTFLDCDGVNVIVNVMRGALTENDYKDYVDCIIPAVSILKYVCIYSSSTRQDLYNNFDIYFYILRGLFMFCSEDRMRQDCSILLCLLLFHGYILGSPMNSDFSLPHLVVDKLSLPFICRSHSRTSKHTLPDLTTTLLSDKWCLSSMQIHWNSEWFGGFMEILSWDKIKYSETYLDEFSEQLLLTNSDLMTLKSSSYEFCISKCLTDIQNGTSHNAIVEAINMLDNYIHLYALTKDKAQTEKNNILTFPWECTFARFLSVPPANEEDLLLLVLVLKFLAKLVPLYTSEDSICWLLTMLKNPSCCLPNLLQIDSLPDLEIKALHQELLSLIVVCVRHEQHCFDLHLRKKNELSSGWMHIVVVIADNLKLNDTQHFYNLAYLDCVLSCLVHLTTALGWSATKSGSVPKEPIPGLILKLCELVGAFHCGKGASAADSLMGSSITRHIILVLNHLLAEMQCSNVKGWEMCFIAESAIEENILFNLCTLWISRDVILRAAILQLLAGLAVAPRGAIELVQEIKNTKSGNGIWETSIIILLDHEEASVVREGSANLLSNLTSHVEASSSKNLTLITNIAPTTTRKDSCPISKILCLLEEFQFFKELHTILENLYVNPSFDYDNGHCTVSINNTPKDAVQTEEYAFTYTKNIVPDFSTTTRTSKSTLSSNKRLSVLVTPGLLKCIAIFVQNLLILSEHEVSNLLHEHGLIKLFFKSLSIPPIIIDNTKDLSLYCDILEMNTAICGLLCKAVGSNQLCRGTILHTRDCLNVLLSLLDPSLYYTKLSQLTYLRNRLWTEIFSLIAILADDTFGIDVYTGEVLAILLSLLNECGQQPFLQTLCVAIGSNCSTDLQQAALTSLTSLLRAESKSSLDDCKQQDAASIKNLLDNVKTSRTAVTDENVEQKQDKVLETIWEHNDHEPISLKQKMNTLENTYFGKVHDKLNELNKKPVLEPHSVDEPLVAGAELCRTLLELYDVSNIRSKDGKQVKKKSAIVNTLTSILCVSVEAKKVALRNGLMEKIIQQLREAHVRLSLESVACLRRITDKKRVCPILKEIGSLVGLITNFMLGNESVKYSAAELGLADLVHKLWVWFCIERSLLIDVLKMLCTYTTNCYTACQSLPLTSSVAGSGPRKLPSNLSLLHELILLIFKEMDLVSNTHDLNVLELTFHLLHNSCTALECRNLLAKSNLMSCLSRLHPAITKRQKTWENVELLWLQFLLTFTGYPEGQACVPKATDAFEIVMTLSSSTKSVNRRVALSVLRNVAFYQPNRPRLINSADFINILQSKMSSGNLEEKNLIVTIMWALVANNQRAKLILKCAGLDIKLQELLKTLSLIPDDFGAENIEMMRYVLDVLKEGEKVKY